MKNNTFIGIYVDKLKQMDVLVIVKRINYSIGIKLNRELE